ncbi:hypothetical protein [Acutalibacter sp. 1XD8-33]|uniref:hypothetical protein n=1 Tax=Acutalibacter sp. 1XD8-33 TaxID=2320081 RepID=UPI0011C41F2F|nr:hypothetical protein [Acutalibacter sp. 1XD8-33]
MVSNSGEVTTNQPPTVPSSITVPSTVYGGKPVSISWGGSTDPDGNLEGYSLERQVDSGAWAEVYSGPELSFTDTITKGWETVAYRVRAHDSHPCLGGLHRRDEKRTQLCF